MHTYLSLMIFFHKKTYVVSFFSNWINQKSEKIILLEWILNTGSRGWLYVRINVDEYAQPDILINQQFRFRFMQFSLEAMTNYVILCYENIRGRYKIFMHKNLVGTKNFFLAGTRYPSVPTIFYLAGTRYPSVPTIGAAHADPCTQCTVHSLYCIKISVISILCTIINKF